MVQLAVPIDKRFAALGNWTEGAGDGDSVFWDELDEGFPADDATTYWQSPTSPTLEEIAAKVQSIDDPGVNTDHKYRGRSRKSASAGQQLDVQMQFYDLTTQTAELNFANIDTTWTTREETMTGAEADAIDNYNNLGIGNRANKVGGGAPRQVWESAFEFECPDVSAAIPHRVKQVEQAVNRAATY